MEQKISHTINGNVYLISDCHFGAPNRQQSLIRENLFIQWLDEVKQDATHIILLGDIFDFWFEYKHVVPKGYIRILGKFAELSDMGIKFIFFTGNHDFWIRNYFETEFGFEIIRSIRTFLINGKKVMIGHGDGIGPKDTSYKIMKYIFEARINRWLYSRLHPGFAFWLALTVSSKSRAANGNADEVFYGEDKERLLIYAKQVEQKEHFDYFIFGHRHLPMQLPVGPNATYINTGDWIKSFSYAKTEGDAINLKTFNAKKQP